MGGKGGIRVGKKKGGIMISMCNVGWHGEGCATQRRQVVILQHLPTLRDSTVMGFVGWTW